MVGPSAGGTDFKSYQTLKIYGDHQKQCFRLLKHFEIKCSGVQATLNEHDFHVS